MLICPIISIKWCESWRGSSLTQNTNPREKATGVNKSTFINFKNEYNTILSLTNILEKNKHQSGYSIFYFNPLFKKNVFLIFIYICDNEPNERNTSRISLDTIVFSLNIILIPTNNIGQWY